MQIKDKNIVVTGGSRGLGLALVEVLAARGANVTVVARDPDALHAVRTKLEVDIISADITDKTSAQEILSKIRPDVVVLNAGAKPPMGRLDEITWERFTETWESDVRGGLYWVQAALNVPLNPGSRVLVGSSGAAAGGSPLSGGYAGAKRMLWIMAKYANGISDQKNLGIRFQAILPMQMIAGTGVGDRGAQAYAEALGISPAAFLAKQFGTPLALDVFGAQVVSVLEEGQYDSGLAFGIRGDTGVTVLEGIKS